MIKLLIGLVLGLAAPAALDWLALDNIAPLPSDEQVYSICMRGHFDTTPAIDKACADGLAATNNQFLCNYNGQKCWLERN